MQQHEFEGKTTEEAIEKASKKLNIPTEELDFDIIEPGSAGIFGLVGNKKAKIRVNIKTEEQAPESEPFEEEGPQEDAVRLAKETLENILSRIPVTVTVEAQSLDGNINLNIVGDNSGLLIGRRGKTLDAFQFIVNKIVNKQLAKRTRVVVDSERYRERRKESLVQLARRMGDKAKRIRKPVTTNPLNPGDRRIVHLALKEDEDLDTRSRGDGMMKKVVIIPKR